jgi:hypothetical protein
MACGLPGMKYGCVSQQLISSLVTDIHGRCESTTDEQKRAYTSHLRPAGLKTLGVFHEAMGSPFVNVLESPKHS